MLKSLYYTVCGLFSLLRLPTMSDEDIRRLVATAAANKHTVYGIPWGTPVHQVFAEMHRRGARLTVEAPVQEDTSSLRYAVTFERFQAAIIFQFDPGLCALTLDPLARVPAWSKCFHKSVVLPRW